VEHGHAASSPPLFFKRLRLATRVQNNGGSRQLRAAHEEKEEKTMKTKLFGILLLAGSALFAAPVVGFGVAPAPVAVYAAPPAPLSVYVPAARPGYTWIAGYWHPYGARYRWHGGYWARAPYARSYWVAPHWYGHRYYGGYWRR
jgi:hypothetical protein